MRLSHPVIEANFNQWVNMLGGHESLSRQSKLILLPELRQTRHIIIVNMHQVYKEGIHSELLDSDYPYVITTKSTPYALLDCYSSMEEAIDFCESVGITWDIHIYPDTSMAVH